MHPDFDSKPARNPFNRYPVVAYRVEQGSAVAECFFVFEFDLANDDLGPLKPPGPVSETDARARLADLGLSTAETEARVAWAREWMATRFLQAGADGVSWLPPF